MNYYLIAIINSSQSFTYSFADHLPVGAIVKVPLRSSIKDGIVLSQTKKPTAYKTKDIQSVTKYYIDEVEFKIAKFISSYYFCDLPQSLSIFVPCQKGAKEFKLQNSIKKPMLTKAQERALKELKHSPISLLFGVTGSGKTEVYISYIYEILMQNKTALVLMPEIGLTPQIEKRLKSFFGDIVGVWHSKLTKVQKRKFLQRLSEGKIGLVVGARSALFLPLQNLGLIVVDEEHDDSYKSSQKPRYHARDMAIYKANLLQIPIILASATPSLSSYVKFHTVKLNSSYIQTQKSYQFVKGDEFDGYLLHKLLANKDNQSILFIPTRGNFKYLKCNSCGEFVKCPFCSVGMSLHRKKNAMVCHYCHFAQPIPQRCPNCQELSLSSKRMGTAEVMSKLEPYEQINAKQFDTDTISTNKKLRALLESFESGETSVLVGTQMLSKGHDYPNVTLSIILGIDFLLSQADYRAREKAMGLFLQIAGRCGRNKSATVITQTANEDFFVRYKADYEAFLQDEIEFRKQLYPPFKTLAKFLFSDTDPKKAEDRMQAVVQKLQKIDVETVGYGANLIEKIANRYRFQILLRADSKQQMQNAIAKVYDGSFEVDMDCIHFD